MSKADFFLKKTLGEDFLESLQKVELWKPGTKSTIDHEEIHTALKIVPRTIMALLIRELTPMAIGDNKDFTIPCEKETIISVNKHERDVYSGDIKQENVSIVDFKLRSIPGVGLVIMSALELYDLDELQSKNHQQTPDIDHKVQQLIEERMAIHELVNKVVDRKMAEKDAIQQLLLARMTDQLRAAPKHDVKPEETHSFMAMSEKSAAKKGSPLGSFLEQRKSKSGKNEFKITLAKGEQVHCPDCGQNIFNGQALSGCICVGDDMEKKVFLKKTEDGIQVRFSKGWDQENVEMLLEILRRKNG